MRNLLKDRASRQDDVIIASPMPISVLKPVPDVANFAIASPITISASSNEDPPLELSDDEDDEIKEDTNNASTSSPTRAAAPIASSIIESQSSSTQQQIIAVGAGMPPNARPVTAVSDELPKVRVNNTKYPNFDYCKVIGEDTVENILANIERAIETFNFQRVQHGIEKINYAPTANQQAFKFDCDIDTFEEFVAFMNDMFNREKIYNSTLQQGAAIQPLTDEVRQELEDLEKAPVLPQASRAAQFNAANASAAHPFWSAPPAAAAPAPMPGAGTEMAGDADSLSPAALPAYSF